MKQAILNAIHRIRIFVDEIGDIAVDRCPFDNSMVLEDAQLSGCDRLFQPKGIVNLFDSSFTPFFSEVAEYGESFGMPDGLQDPA